MEFINDFALGLPTKVVAIADIKSSRKEYISPELNTFCRTFTKNGRRGTDFESLTQRQGDGFYFVLKNRDKASLQKGLKSIHSYPAKYRKKHRKLPGRFKEYLDRDSFFRCGVSIGSIGYGKNDPRTNLGYVYAQCVEAMNYYDDALPVNGKIIKAVIMSVYHSQGFDVIMNCAETAISAMEGEKRWASHRKVMIQAWDNLIIQLKKELEDKERWHETDDGQGYVFCKSPVLDHLVKGMISLCESFWEKQEYVNGSIELRKLHKALKVFEDEDEYPAVRKIECAEYNDELYEQRKRWYVVAKIICKLRNKNLAKD